MPEAPNEAIAETDNFIVWETREPDDEVTYHVELGAVTLHFFPEEWQEFTRLIKVAASNS